MSVNALAERRDCLASAIAHRLAYVEVRDDELDTLVGRWRAANDAWRAAALVELAGAASGEDPK